MSEIYRIRKKGTNEYYTPSYFWRDGVKPEKAKVYSQKGNAKLAIKFRDMRGYEIVAFEVSEQEKYAEPYP